MGKIGTMEKAFMGYRNKMYGNESKKDRRKAGIPKAM
jgi:hypothetical protein